MDKRESQTNGPEDMRIDDYAWGPRIESWYRSYISKKEGRRELASIDTSIERLDDYIKRAKKD